MADSNIAWFGLAGAIIGAIPSLFGAVIPWIRDREKSTREKRAIELAKMEVDFVSAWIETASKFSSDAIEPHKARAQERLILLLGASSSVQPQLERLVAERGHGKGRAAFLIYLGIYCFMLFGASIDNSKNVSLGHFLNEVRGEGVWALIVLAVPLLVLFFRWRRSVKREGGT